MHPSELPPGCLCTRSEEIEEDDVSRDASVEYIQRAEPMPWGTLRLKDYGDRFNEAVRAKERGKRRERGKEDRVGGRTSIGGEG